MAYELRITFIFNLGFGCIHLCIGFVIISVLAIISTTKSIPPPPVFCHLFVVGGGLSTSMTRITMLTRVFILLVGPPKSDRLKDRGHTK